MASDMANRRRRQEEVGVEALRHVRGRNPMREVDELIERQAKFLLAQHVGQSRLTLVEQRTVVLQFGKTIAADKIAVPSVACQQDAGLFERFAYGTRAQRAHGVR